MAKSLGLLGRPIYEVTPQVLADLEQYAYDGMSKREISDCLGISETTLNIKLKDYPNFKAAYDKGRREGLIDQATKIRRVKESLFRNADDHEVIIKDQPVTVPGDVKAQIFIMKAKAGWSDQKVEISGNPEKPILIAPLFAKNYQKDLDKFTQVIDEANE